MNAKDYVKNYYMMVVVFLLGFAIAWVWASGDLRATAFASNKINKCVAESICQSLEMSTGKSSIVGSVAITSLPNDFAYKEVSTEWWMEGTVLILSFKK